MNNQENLKNNFRAWNITKDYSPMLLFMSSRDLSS
jgi:hypothetical protein